MNERKRKKPRNVQSRSRRREEDLQDFSDSKEVKFRKGKPGSNDVAWYARNPQLLKDAASYPFSQPVGRRWDTHSHTTTKYECLPGILAFRCRPCFGFGGRVNIATQAVTADVNNPLNVAAAEMYTYVRKMNSGAKNYEASDLMMYVIAMSQVYSYITWAMRIYGFARMYEQRNRYMPEALCRANGVDYASIRDNLANYRYGLNVLINKAASLKVPAEIPLFQRSAFLYQNVYSEGDSVKDQLYMYVPESFLEFNLDSSGAGQLTNVISIPNSSDTLWTYQDILTTGNAMFQAIWDEEDFATMSGDINKAFEGKVLELNVLNEDYGLIPICDPMVLTQMKNTRVLNVNANSAVHQVSSSAYTSLLVPLQYMAYESSLSGNADRDNYATADYLNREKVLTINAVEPDPGMVIESTRMLAGLDEVVTMPDASNVNHDVVFIAASSEICTRIEFIFIEASTMQYNSMRFSGTLHINESNLDLSAFSGILRRAWLMKNFKYAPEWSIYYSSSAGASDPSTWSYSNMFEVDNYTTIGPDEIKKLHESAILSLLNVTSIGSNLNT